MSASKQVRVGDMTVTVLVTGGAGYVGSHCCRALASSGYVPIAYDNLTNGHSQFVKWGPFERGDIRDGARLAEVLAKHKPAAVVHCAGLIEVGVSLEDPYAFYENNVSGTLTLLDAMRINGPNIMMLSSTCAVYGAPLQSLLDEKHPRAPLNPYGRSKLMVEQIIEDAARAYGLRFGQLRYFNAAGAAYQDGIGERHDPETHVLPLAVLAALGRRAQFKVFGDDYDTPDGTCIRDYVHVEDLARAHVLTLARLLDGSTNLTLNLGGGVGTSVHELLEAVQRATGRALNVETAARRLGDAARLVADITLAQQTLGWDARHSLDDIVHSAWQWHACVEPVIFQQ